MSEFDINHVYSTPYHPSSNGGVERCNRSIIQLLKGLIQDDINSWDEKIHKLCVVYNNTVHSQTGYSPSSMILEQCHKVVSPIPIREKIKKTWKVGNPKFSPYQVNQRVIYQIQRKGRLVNDKLKQLYEGPYDVIQVLPNDVAYKIRRSGVPSAKIMRAHYDQLKPFNEVPPYLKNTVSQVANGGKYEQENSSSSSDFDICVPQSADEVEIIPLKEVTICEVNPNGVIVSEPQSKAKESASPFEARSLELNQARSQEVMDGHQGSVESTDFLKTDSSLKLYLEGEKSNNTTHNENSVSSELASPQTGESFKRLCFGKAPLNMLQCSEMVEEDPDQRHFVASTPQSTVQRKAEFWSISNASPLNSRQTVTPRGLPSDLESSPSDGSLAFIEVLEIINFNRKNWKQVASIVKAELTSSKEYETAIQLEESQTGSSEVFEGFSTDENGAPLKNRVDILNKLASVAKCCELKNQQFSSSKTMESIRESLHNSSEDTMQPRSSTTVKDNETDAFRRITRSTGIPLDLPNVQPKILERRKRRHSMNQ